MQIGQALLQYAVGGIQCVFCRAEVFYCRASARQHWFVQSIRPFIRSYIDRLQCSATHPRRTKSGKSQDILEAIPNPAARVKSPTIRALRQWEVENQNLVLPILELKDLGRPSLANNAHAMQTSDDTSYEDSAEDFDVGNQLPFTVEDLVDFGNTRTFLQTGDLVELR